MNKGNDGMKEASEKPRRNRKRGIAVSAVAAVILVSSLAGWMTYRHQYAVASADCRQNVAASQKTAKTYDRLLKGEAHTTANIDPATVRDTKTITALKATIKDERPKTVTCDADSLAGLKTQKTSAHGSDTWYRLHSEKLRKAVKAVKDSQTAKTIDQANQLLKDSEGKVQDETTRERLSKAIETKNNVRIRQAMNEVTGSMQAKQSEDAQAKAATASSVQENHGASDMTDAVSGNRTSAQRPQPNGRAPSQAAPARPAPVPSPSSTGQKPGWDGTVNFDGTDDTSGAWHNISIPRG